MQVASPTRVHSLLRALSTLFCKRLVMSCDAVRSTKLADKEASRQIPLAIQNE